MGGFIKDFALTALIIILNHWIYGVEDIISYEFVVNFIARNKTFFLVTGIFGSSALVISAIMFENLGLSKVTYAVSKVLVRTSQFLITFLAILNLVFYAALGNNLMRDNGYLLLVALVFILGSSCWALRMIDFNYHTQNVLVPVGVMAFMSIILVEFLWPYYHF